MRCELTHELVVNQLLIFCELAWLEPRPELGHLCRTAKKEERIEQETIEQALRGISPAGAKNILAHCQYLGLCAADGSLTELGREVAETDYAPVPEQGVFRFWMASHPLFGGIRLLNVERVAPDPKSTASASAPLPSSLPTKRRFSSVIHPAERFVLTRLLSNSNELRCVREPDTACRLSWHLDFTTGTNIWQLTGTFAVKEGVAQLQHKPESATLDLAVLQDDWGARYLAEHGRWQKQRLHIPWKSVAGNEAAQESFVSDVRLKQVAIAGLGEYRDVVLREVPLSPASPADASEWAWARLSRRLRSQSHYQTRQMLRDRFSEIVDGTPLSAGRPTLPAHTDLLRTVDGDPKLLFQLAASVDLAPVPTPSELLGAQSATVEPGAA